MDEGTRQWGLEYARQGDRNCANCAFSIEDVPEKWRKQWYFDQSSICWCTKEDKREHIHPGMRQWSSSCHVHEWSDDALPVAKHRWDYEEERLRDAKQMKMEV